MPRVVWVRARLFNGTVRIGRKMKCEYKQMWCVYNVDSMCCYSGTRTSVGEENCGCKQLYPEQPVDGMYLVAIYSNEQLKAEEDVVSMLIRDITPIDVNSRLSILEAMVYKNIFTTWKMRIQYEINRRANGGEVKRDVSINEFVFKDEPISLIDRVSNKVTENEMEGGEWV